MRLLDHEPLTLAAARAEPTVILYVYEDCHLKSDTYHAAHHVFINDGLADLDAKIDKDVEVSKAPKTPKSEGAAERKKERQRRNFYQEREKVYISITPQ